MNGASLLDDLARICRPVQLPPPVYAGYLAIKIRNALRGFAGVPPDERVVEPDSVAVESLGGAKYAVHCRDFQGTNYRITVEVERGE